MKAFVITSFLLLACFLVVNPGLEVHNTIKAAPAGCAEDKSEREQAAANHYGKLPLSFVENRGQFDEQVRFQARSPRATVHFTPTEVVFHFIERNDANKVEAMTMYQRSICRQRTRSSLFA